MKKILGYILVTLFLIPALVRAEQVSLSVDEAVALALRDNRSILLKSEELNKAKAKIAEANAGLFPTLNFTGGWTYTSEYYADKDIGQTAMQATLKQYLYKGGKVINTIQYNGINFEIVQTTLDKTRLEVALSARKAFFTLLLAQELADLNKGITENSLSHLAYLKARYNNGEVSESEVLKAEASVSSTQQGMEASLNQIETVTELLRNLLYLDEKVTIKTEGDFSCEPKEFAYAEGFLKAMQQRPEIKQYELQAKANKKAVEIAKADNRPNIYASWDYYNRSHPGATTSRNWNDHNVLGFTFTWPIFDGWLTKAKVEQALADVKEANFSKQRIVKDILLELKESYGALKDSLGKLKAAEADMVAYKDNLSVAEEKARQGKASSLELDDAKLKFSISEFNQKQAIYDYLVAKAEFDKATGGI